ncbi:MAG: DNA translocase FtsK 4TM domain-containing protein, partial [Parvularculaceae bacterium]
MPRKKTRRGARAVYDPSADVDFADDLPARLRRWRRAFFVRAGGVATIFLGLWLAAAFATFSISDASFNAATAAPTRNVAGPAGAAVSDLLLQSFGAASLALIAPLLIWAPAATRRGARRPHATPPRAWARLGA